MKATANLYSFQFSQVRTYLFAALFVAGNLVLPQLCHLVQGGGMVWLPIYFFTLIAAYKYGLHVGLLTAVFSPLLNSLLFGMPAGIMLAVVLCKSGLLAVATAFIAQRWKTVSLLAILLSVLAYQAVGTLAQGAFMQDFSIALQHLQMAFPGMLLQLVGGYFVLKAMKNI